MILSKVEFFDQDLGAKGSVLRVTEENLLVVKTGTNTWRLHRSICTLLSSGRDTENKKGTLM